MPWDYISILYMRRELAPAERCYASNLEKELTAKDDEMDPPSAERCRAGGLERELKAKDDQRHSTHHHHP